MTKDQLITELKNALMMALNHPPIEGFFLERCTELIKTVPLTDTEERMEAMRLEILERSRAAAEGASEAAQARRATSIPSACVSCGYAPCMCDQQ